MEMAFFFFNNHEKPRFRFAFVGKLTAHSFNITSGNPKLWHADIMDGPLEKSLAKENCRLSAIHAELGMFLSH